MSGKRQKTQYTQLRLAFAMESRGETLDAVRQGTEPLTAKRTPESPAEEERLMEEVCDRKNLEIAWKRVRGNKGSPGVDGLTIDETMDYLREHWPTIREQLLDGTYAPQPVKRVEIPKPDGGVRKRGVPCVVDRLIQQALLQVLQKRWDPTFSEHSYGFRPGRSAHQAVAQAQRYVADGYGRRYYYHPRSDRIDGHAFPIPCRVRRVLGYSTTGKEDRLAALPHRSDGPTRLL